MYIRVILLNTATYKPTTLNRTAHLKKTHFFTDKGIET